MFSSSKTNSSFTFKKFRYKSVRERVRKISSTCKRLTINVSIKPIQNESNTIEILCA